jgi:signal transduction histidine kinase
MAQKKRHHRVLGFGLRGRLLLYFAVLVFSAVGASTWLLTLRGQGLAASSLSDMTSSVARSLAIAAAINDDPAALRALARSQVSGEQVLAVAFVDGSGKSIASAGRDGLEAASLSVDGAMAPRQINTPAGAALMISVPVQSARADDVVTPKRVVVITSMRSISRNTRAMCELIALVGSGVTLTAAMLAWVLVHRARRPLRELVNSVRAVTAGESDSVSQSAENEQVAELAVAFNEMVEGVRVNRAQLAAANEDLANSVRGLEQKIVDRTAQLEAANDRLSGEIAEKEDFLRAVSHDLNAPLRNIAGMVSMLMTKNRESLPEDVVSRLDRIRKNVDVESDLINELLELSRIKTRRQKLDRVDTEGVVWELRGTFENDLKTRSIELIIETSLPPLWAERARVRQVFQNLIDNAIKYMGDGPTREIRIGCNQTVTEAAFYVRDTGLGIHPEDIDKVFFVFRRGRGEQSTKVPGKGVGLSSVKSIVETYAGQIRVESVLGSGSAFYFTINGKFVATPDSQPPIETDVRAAAALANKAA